VVVTLVEPCGDGSSAFINWLTSSDDQLSDAELLPPGEEFTMSSAKLVELRPSRTDMLSTCIKDFLEFFTAVYSSWRGKTRFANYLKYALHLYKTRSFLSLR
jgi:hypothetical protein